jgi:hypothetical protein
VTVFITELATSPIGGGDLVDLVTVNDSTHLDCPLLNKLRVLMVNEGQPATIEWELRNNAGEARDYSSVIPPGGGESETGQQVILRFTDACGNENRIMQIIGEPYDPVNGLIRCQLPSEFVDAAGVFVMSIAVTDDEGVVRIIDKGYASVERTLFGDYSTIVGPPTIGELRLLLRDTLLENSLLDDVEFDDAELITALARPIRYWNETPPPIAVYGTRTFPYHDAWLKATSAYLLKTAAVWYERNRLSASHGGINVDAKNKLNPYQNLPMDLENELTQFVLAKKISLNVAAAYGSIGSAYG